MDGADEQCLAQAMIVRVAVEGERSAARAARPRGHQAFSRHSTAEPVVEVGRLEIGPGQHRQMCEVREAADIGRHDAGGVQALAIEGYRGVRVADDGL
jgi:hypothetical protein